MENVRWEVQAIARWFNDRELVLESIGKHLYHTSSGNNYMLNPQCEEKIQVTRTLFFLYDEPKLSDLKLQEILFFVSNFSYFIISFT